MEVARAAIQAGSKATAVEMVGSQAAAAPVAVLAAAAAVETAILTLEGLGGAEVGAAAEAAAKVGRVA